MVFFLNLLRSAALALLAASLFGCSDPASKLLEHQKRGESYLEKEQYAEAVLEFKNVLQIDPNHPGAHYGLAQAYIAQKDARQAYWELQESVRLDPGNLEAKVQYAQYLLFGKEEDLQEAVARMDEVLAEEPANETAWIIKGRALENLKRPEAARVAFEKATEVAPEKTAPLFQLANFLRRSGEAQAAEPLYRKLVEVESSFTTHAALGGFLAGDRKRDGEAEASYRKALGLADGEQQAAAYSLLANFYYSRERYDAAEEVLRQGIEAQPDNLDLIYTLARLFHSRGEVAEADAMIEAATRARPDEAKPYLVLSSYRGSNGDLDGALVAAESALAAEPSSHPALLRKAELLVDIGFQKQDEGLIDEGRRIVQGVLAGDASNPEGLFVKAKLDIAEGRLGDAVEALRRGIEGRSDWAQAHFLLGSALFLQRDFNSARASILRSLELDPNLVDSQRVLARIHAALGEDELAIEAGRRVLARGEDPPLRILVAQSLIKSDRMEEAKAQLEAIPQEQRDAEAYYAMGRVAYLGGDAETARRQFLKALEQDPHRHEILRALLDLDLRAERLAESARRIEAAQQARPDDARIAQLMGLVALYSGDAEVAEASFRRAIELDPNDVRGYENLARYLLVTGRPDEVLKTYEQALERNPESGTLNLIVGSLYELRSRTGDAIARYEEAVRLDPRLAVAKNNLAYLLAESGGDLDRALDLAQSAKEQLPDNPNTADTLGWVLYRKNVPSAAIGYLKEAERGLAADDSQLGTVRHHLALAYEANGQKREAREVLERALSDLEAQQARREASRGEPAWAADARAMLKRLEAPGPAREG